MRIAWIGAGPAEGGVGGVAKAIITRMAERGHEIDCFVPGGLTALPELPECSRLRVFSAGGWWQWRRWYSRTQIAAFVSSLLARALAQLQLTRVLRTEHRACPYDVVYQFSNIEMFGLQRQLSKLPPIVIHPETHIAGELRWYRRETSLRRRCETRWRSAAVRVVLEIRSRRQRRHVTHADLVVCISNSFRDDLMRDYGVSLERTVVVPNPVDLDLFRPDLHENPDLLTLVFIGRMSVRKGLEHLIELSHRLDDLSGQIKLKFVGGHSLWSDYRPLLEGVNLGVAELIGPVSFPEIPRLVAAADVLIQPSAYEPFGLTVAEALACGTPVVITEAVGAGDFVEGSSVVKVKSSDPDALEHGVRTMIERVRCDSASLREEARSAAERAFDVIDVVAELETRLAELCIRRRSSTTAAGS